MICAVYLPNPAPSSSLSILFGARPPDGLAVDERAVHPAPGQAQATRRNASELRICAARFSV